MQWHHNMQEFYISWQNVCDFKRPKVPPIFTYQHPLDAPWKHDVVKRCPWHISLLISRSEHWCFIGDIPRIEDHFTHIAGRTSAFTCHTSSYRCCNNYIVPWMVLRSIHTHIFWTLYIYTYISIYKYHLYIHYIYMYILTI